MKAYSENLRQKIVAALERGMSKCEAARLFCILKDVGVKVSRENVTGRKAETDEKYTYTQMDDRGTMLGPLEAALLGSRASLVIGRTPR